MADTSDTKRRETESTSAEVLNVTELNGRIASLLEERSSLNSVRCIGEVTDLHQNNTALYCTLIDGDTELPV